MPFASEKERDVANQVLKILLSEKYKPKNYLFLEPFDLNEVPDYLETVGKPLDLRSISERFYQDMYDAPSFWADVENVYKNAIKYHGSKPASKWIAKFASDMLKALGKERKKIENPTEKPKAKIKVKLKASPESGDTGTFPPNMADHAPSMQLESLPPKPKTKLKLQLPTSSSIPPGASSSIPLPPPVPSSANQDAAAKRPKLKIKLSNKGSVTDSNPPLPVSSANLAVASASDAFSAVLAAPAMASTEGSAKSVPKKAKPTQPKFKLKLSLKKTADQTTANEPKIGKKPQPTVPKTEAYDDDDEEEGEVKQDATPVRPPVAVPEPKPSAPPPAPVATQKIKIPASAGPSRGKELPQGVSAPQPPAPSVPKPKKPKKATSSTKKAPVVAPMSTGVTGTGAGATTASTQPGGLELQQTKQCSKVILGLKRRKNKQISWFLTPVSDKSILPDYKSKIKSPMDLQTIQSKLDKGSYRKVDAFCLDLRRVFANALRYNTSIKDSLRPLAVEVLQSAESLMLTFISRHYQLSYPPLLYCWKVCIDILDTLYNLVNPTDGQPMAYYFLHPVSVYFGGKFPTDYLEKVKKPMDFGTITANLLEGRYQTVDAFATDCRLVVQNCQTYYQGKEESRVFLDQATQLNDCLTSQLSQLARYDKSIKGDAERRKAAQLTNQSRIVQEMILPNQPPAALFLSVLEDLRALKYTDKGTKITEPAMGPFEKPVSTADFPDYLQFVLEPMDLQAIERKIKLGTVYETPEDYEYDMNIVFKNCEVFNSKRNAQHSVSMAKFGMKKFRSVFYAKMQAYEDPTSISPSKVQLAVAPIQPADIEQTQTSAPPAKKIKLDTSGTSKGKAAPRTSASVSQAGSSSATNPAAAVARAKSPSTSQPRQTPQTKPDQPVPLHIAIAKVKEAFPLRRAVKSLQSWEADCARYFKEMMRHPWISAARPKFVFSCPVPILFPELREHYAAKIKKSMDLTTIECTLLAGNRYAGVEDFIQDVALVFANAIRFNKDGKDIGDPLSSAYYDASVHLLRYSRWLSLELLSNHIDDSDHTDLPSPDGLPPFSWKLTTGNRKFARQEVEAVVLKEPIEKSLEGDRYTWMEAECEKLLKALRHQSDLRYMTFFIQPNYPPDYTAFISKPMDWEKVQRTLKKRHYDTIGALIDDLRLIFSNAERYNSRLKGTDTVSGRAYEAAKYMSDKLELAINRLVLSVSDRLERERIDHSNAEREIEAAERAEEDAIRAAWKKEPDREESSSATSRSEVMAQRIRIVRRAPQRRQSTDFEIPFFDEEDDGMHERSYFEVVKFQKVMFEKQRQEQSKMRKISSAIGASVLSRLIRRDIAEEESAIAAPDPSTSLEEKTSGKANGSDGANDEASSKPSDVLGELEREGRSRFQIQFLSKVKKNPPKRKRALQGFD